MPCNHINNIRNIKKYQNKGINLPQIDKKPTKVSNIIVSNSFPRDKYSEKFNENNSKMYLNNYVKDYENIEYNDDYDNIEDIDYSLFGIAEEEDIIEIEKNYNKRQKYRNEKEIEKMFKNEKIFSNNLSKTQTIDLKKLSKITSNIKEYTESKDDCYEILREKLPPPRYN